MSKFNALPVGATLESHHGNKWRKRTDGLWDILTDPSWGPCQSEDIPFYAREVQ